jgi:hypothetical protein
VFTWSKTVTTAEEALTSGVNASGAQGGQCEGHRERHLTASRPGCVPTLRGRQGYSFQKPKGPGPRCQRSSPSLGEPWAED